MKPFFLFLFALISIVSTSVYAQHNVGSRFEYQAFKKDTIQTVFKDSLFNKVITLGSVRKLKGTERERIIYIDSAIYYLRFSKTLGQEVFSADRKLVHFNGDETVIIGQTIFIRQTYSRLKWSYKTNNAEVLTCFRYNEGKSKILEMKSSGEFDDLLLIVAFIDAEKLIKENKRPSVAPYIILTVLATAAGIIRIVTL